MAYFRPARLNVAAKLLPVVLVVIVFVPVQVLAATVNGLFVTLFQHSDSVEHIEAVVDASSEVLFLLGQVLGAAAIRVKEK